MKEKQIESYLPLVEPTAAQPSPASSNARTSSSVARRVLSLALGALALVHLGFQLTKDQLNDSSTSSIVHWQACGDGMQCTTILAPLDWRNSSDPRKVELAVARFRADPSKGERLGSIFVNPGGPGGSGTAFVHGAGGLLATLSGGQYDIIGFDPRGVNATRPYVSCHENALDEYLYARTAPLSLDLPVNFSAIGPGASSDPQAVVDHLYAQMRATEATGAALFKQCSARTGDALALMGTDFVVRDIDLMSKLIDGPFAKINYWGFSYGTILGQYLTAILPAERIGRVAIDGVVDATMWTGRSVDSTSLEDIDSIFRVFAETCATAGDRCALSHLGSGPAILAAMDKVIDSLYASPAPVLSIPDAPGLLARSYHARGVAFQAAYGIGKWPALAESFADALNGKYAKLVSSALAATALDGTFESAQKKHDSSRMAVLAIRCADQAPYTEEDPAPTSAEVADEVLYALDAFSHRVGESLSILHRCEVVNLPKRSYYNGTFEWEQSAFETPVLILSQKFDPVTPLSSAKIAYDKYGKSNARLIEQNGTGHCTISQASLTTAKIMRDFWLEGVLPEAEHTFTEVVQLPFGGSAGAGLVEPLDVGERELLEAWKGVGDVLLQN